MTDGEELLGESVRHGLLITSAVITLLYCVLSFTAHSWRTVRLTQRQLRRVMHRRENLSVMAFLVLLLITQMMTINLSAYVSNENIARRVSEVALFSWIMLCGLALMTTFVACVSRMYARVHLYLGLVLTNAATLILLADALVSGKVAALDPLAGTACLVGLWATFYAVPVAFNLNMLMMGSESPKITAYKVLHKGGGGGGGGDVGSNNTANSTFLNDITSYEEEERTNGTDALELLPTPASKSGAKSADISENVELYEL